MWRLFWLSLSKCASELDVESVALEISKQWPLMGTVLERVSRQVPVGLFCVVR